MLPAEVSSSDVANDESLTYNTGPLSRKQYFNIDAFPANYRHKVGVELKSRILITGHRSNPSWGQIAYVNPITPGETGTHLPARKG